MKPDKDDKSMPLTRRAYQLTGLFLVFISLTLAAQDPMTIAEVLATSSKSDWRSLDPQNTLYMELDGGRVIIELAPFMAPDHVQNVRALAREHYFDGLAILRVQDNYVTQWGDPNGENPKLVRPIKTASRTLPAEFDRPVDPKLPFTPLSDGDVYAPEVGFVDGFPMARDPKSGRIWPIHAYGMIGAGRGDTADSGGGTEIYVVIGQAPRHLDRNVTLFGRVIQGMDLLSSLPRGKGPMGFYEKAEEYIPIKSIRLAAELPETERTQLEILRTDTPLFQKYVEARRNRSEGWFLHKAGHVEIANIPVPLRKHER